MFDEAWRFVDEFRVDQAAALWADENPAQFAHQHAADVVNRINAFKQMLSGAIAGGKLPADHSTNGLRSIGNYDASIVTRDELIKYARLRDLFPGFLFDTIAPELAGDDQEPNEQQASKKKRGRPPNYDWDLMNAKIVLTAQLNGIPEIQARLVEELLQWFAIDPLDDLKERKVPAERLVEERVSRIYNKLKELGWPSPNPTNSKR
jgi:hypothetical protein